MCCASRATQSAVLHLAEIQSAVLFRWVAQQGTHLCGTLWYSGGPSGVR